MPRRLSNIEWATFLQEVDLPSLHLPAWGGVVDWGGMQVLVFHGGSTLDQFLGQGEWFLTDISDRPEIFSGYPLTEDPWAKVAVYSLPKEVIASVAKAPEVVAAAVLATATAVGKTAGALTGPLLSNLTVPLIVVGIIGLFLLVREAHV